jgi:hypothetical protein
VKILTATRSSDAGKGGDPRTARGAAVSIEGAFRATVILCAWLLVSKDAYNRLRVSECRSLRRILRRVPLIGSGWIG